MRLVFLRTAGDRVIVTSGAHFIIGRASDSSLRLFQDTAVSRYHCTIRVDGGHVKIEDMNSLNGTRVNGVVIDSTTELHDADIIQIGATTLTVEISDTPPAAGSTQVNVELSTQQSHRTGNSIVETHPSNVPMG